MTNSYFRQVPNFEYVNRKPNNDTIKSFIEVKNLFKRLKLRSDIFNDVTFFERYIIIGDERPDQIANRFYGDPNYDWLIMLSNNIHNLNSEWPLSQESFDKVMLEKYKTYENLYSGIHHYETKEIKNTRGVVLLKQGERINPTWRTNGNFTEIINTKIGIIFSGNQFTPSKTVTVFPQGPIRGLKIGDQVVIANVAETEYNGVFEVKSIPIADPNGAAIQFTYELPNIPLLALPIKNNSEEVRIKIKSDISEQDYIFLTQIRSNSNYFEYYDDVLRQLIQVPSSDFVVPVTNYEYEIDLENKKREIYLLKPRYVNVILRDIEELMPYKEGSTQFVSETLKRADNIRLFNS